MTDRRPVDVLEDPQARLFDLVAALRQDLASSLHRPGNTYWVRHAALVAVELERRLRMM